MSVSHLYADFGLIPDSVDATSDMGLDAFEEERLAAFESGYQAGWEDAVKAHEQGKDRISADFAQNLQDLSFTYHEALAKLTVAMRPLLELMVTKILPEMAHASLGAHVKEQLEMMAKDHLGAAIEIAVAPDNLDALQLLLEGNEGVCPFELTAEPSMSSGQVYLRNSGREREIDLDALLQGISEAVTAFFHQSNEETAHD